MEQLEHIRRNLAAAKAILSQAQREDYLDILDDRKTLVEVLGDALAFVCDADSHVFPAHNAIEEFDTKFVHAEKP